MNNRKSSSSAQWEPTEECLVQKGGNGRLGPRREGENLSANRGRAFHVEQIAPVKAPVGKCGFVKENKM